MAKRYGKKGSGFVCKVNHYITLSKIFGSTKYPPYIDFGLVIGLFFDVIFDFRIDTMI